MFLELFHFLKKSDSLMIKGQTCFKIEILKFIFTFINVFFCYFFLDFVLIKSFLYTRSISTNIIPADPSI